MPGVLTPRRLGRPAPSALRTQALRLAERLASPLVPADYLDLLSPLRSGAELRGRIIAIHPETPDAVTLVIEPGRDWAGHTPGQYVRIGVDVDGVRRWRAYSLTAPPRADGRITVTVKAITDGVVSNYLVRRLRAGAIVQLSQASGDFTLPNQIPAKVLFLTAGSGITPIMGMLRDPRARLLEDVVLIHSARSSTDVIFGAELRRSASEGRIRLIERHTERDGMLDEVAITSLVPDLSERETWACGPEGLLDTMETVLTEAGAGAALHTERFRPNLLVTGDGGAVTFTQSGVTVNADGATPLLDAGEAAGVLMPFGCRMGICFGCVVPLSEGAVRDLRTGNLTTAAPGDGVRIQTCVSAAAGACHIEL